MAEANRVRIAYRTAGSSDNWQVLRRTNDALTAGTETVRSDEIRADRMRSGQSVVTLTAGGTLDFEFSAKSFDDMLAAAMCTTWEDDAPAAGESQLGVGTDTVKLDILKSYLDEGKHVLLEECEVSQFSLTLDSGSKVTGQISYMGTNVDYEYDPSGDTFDDAPTTLMMNSSSNLSSIKVDGSPLSGMCITSMSLTINNNHQSDQCVGSLYQQHHKGSANITGNKTFRMSANAFDLWAQTITNVPISSSFELGDGDTTYRFITGKEYLSGDLPSGALDDILSLSLDTVAAVDDTGEMLLIERTPPPAEPPADPPADPPAEP